LPVFSFEGHAVPFFLKWKLLIIFSNKLFEESGLIGGRVGYFYDFLREGVVVQSMNDFVHIEVILYQIY
jgi:hypothetical protein